MSLDAIGALSTGTSSASSSSILFQKDKQKEKGASVAYMGPSIGNILNGSTQAAAVRGYHDDAPSV